MRVEKFAGNNKCGNVSNVSERLRWRWQIVVRDGAETVATNVSSLRGKNLTPKVITIKYRSVCGAHLPVVSGGR